LEREVFGAEKRLAKAKETLESTFALGRRAIEQLTMVLSRVAITDKYSGVQHGVQHGARMLRQNAHKQHALHDELVAKLEDGYMLLAHPPAEWRHDVDVDGLTKPTKAARGGARAARATAAAAAQQQQASQQATAATAQLLQQASQQA
jgi:hypothetical protein